MGLMRPSPYHPCAATVGRGLTREYIEASIRTSDANCRNCGAAPNGTGFCPYCKTPTNHKPRPLVHKRGDEVWYNE